MNFVCLKASDIIIYGTALQLGDDNTHLVNTCILFCVRFLADIMQVHIDNYTIVYYLYETAFICK
jgi:hypothetical protein